MNTGQKVLPECAFNSTFSSLSHACLSAGNAVGSLDAIAHAIPNSSIVCPKGCKTSHTTDTSPRMISVENTDCAIQVESTVNCDPLKASNRSIDEEKLGTAQFKSDERRNNGSCWVQLTGHKGNLMINANGEVLKAYCQAEARCLRSLQSDTLRSFVPQFHGEQVVDGTRYVVMQNLLYQFDCPSVMDCKIGHRTYLEDEVMSCRLRPDMYEKMIAVDPHAPTGEEHRQQAVTKLRYMQWRETQSSSAQLGFRIEAIKHHDEPTNQSFKNTTSWSEIKRHFLIFVQRDLSVANQYFVRLKNLRKQLETSDFFKRHELVGSSLLFAHDVGGTANVWMIDFGKSVPLPGGLSVDHYRVWRPGNHEDGYLVGLDNLISLWDQARQECVKQ